MVSSDLRVILVTGATRGIGLAVVEGLAAQGHFLLLGARDAKRGRQVAEQVPGEVQPIQIDVTDHQSVVAASAIVDETYGYLDTLVNNAGINVGQLNPPSQTTQDDLRAVYDTDVFGLLDVTLTFIPLLDRSSAPRVVNVSSLRGSLGSQDSWVGPWSMAYGSAKTAVNAITAHLARELAERAYAVTAVSPGHVATDLTGGNAPLTPQQGAATIVSLAAADTAQANGQFLDEYGRPLPW
jgi:NAD(P)-dependent dehydrogenase (short-subunit alcohol dehydrogenase family)